MVAMFWPARATPRANLTVRDGLEAGVGVQNLLDPDYRLADGFPEAGRSFVATLGVRY